MAIVKSALLLYKPQDQTVKGKVEGFTAQGFILSEICSRANTIDEAMAMIADAALDDEGLSPLKALEVLRKLYGGTSIIGSKEFSYDDKLLRRAGVPDNIRDKASWDVIDEMLWIFRFAWLVNRCQDLSRRANGAEEVRSLLAAQIVRVKETEEIDDCVRKFLLQVIGKWRDDMKKVIVAGSGFTVQKYVVAEELLESEGPYTEQATKRRSRKREKMQPNPYDYDEPIRDRGKLRSRDREMDALRDAWNAEHLQVVEITAPVLCGSTSLFLAMANKYRIQQKFDVDVAYVSLGHLTSDAKSIEKLANGLYDELRIRTGEPQENASLAGEPMRGLENMIRTYCKGSRRLVVGFDDIDHLEQVLEQHDSLQRFLQSIFHLNEMLPNFGVVLIGTIDRADRYRRLRAHTTRFAKPIVLRPIGSRNEPDQVEQLLNAPTDTFLPRWTGKAVNAVLELSGGVPYLVQLLAWNVYEQFQRKYEYPDPILKRGGSGFIYDPLFTEDAVEAVLGVSTFRLGWQYYIHRLERYFGKPDWELARQVLDRYTNDLALVVRATDFGPVNPDDEALLDSERAVDILKRLKTQHVLDESPKGDYKLRIGLMHPDRRVKYRIDDEDDLAEGD